MNEQIPSRLNYVAGLSWRLLAILAFIGVFIFIVIQLKVIVIPFLVALLVTALLFPLVQWLNKKGIKKGLAVATSLVLLVAVIGGLGILVTKQVQSAYPELKDRFSIFVQDTRTTLSGEPFNIGSGDVDSYSNEITNYVQNNSQTLIAGASAVGVTAGHVAAGIFLGFFSVIFLLIDGKNIWRWISNLFPRATRKNLFQAGLDGWKTLVSFVKSQVMVAGVDAVGIGLGAFILQVPLAIPITVMVFLGSFIPVVGAVVTGIIAVVLALVFNGPIAALLMLGLVLLVQLLEGHVLQPFLIGKAVKIHPLAIVLAVSAGSLLAGIPGALFAVPMVAFLNVLLSSLLSRRATKAPVTELTQ